MRSRSLFMALALLPLFAGCHHPSNEAGTAKPPIELLGSAPAAAGTASANTDISAEDAGSAGAVMVLARDVCHVSKADFDRLGQYFDGVLGENMQLKAAFVAGAKSAAVVREDYAKKGELDKLENMACDGVRRTLAALPAVTQG